MLNMVKIVRNGLNKLISKEGTFTARCFQIPNHSDFCYGKEKKTLGYPQLSDSLVIKHGAETSLYSRCKSLTKQ